MSAESAASANHLRRTTSFGATQAITVACWFRLNSVTGFHSIWSADNNASFFPALYASSTNLMFTNNGTQDLQVLTGLAINTWYWFGVIFTPGGANSEYYTKVNSGAVTHTAGTQVGGGYGSARFTIYDEDNLDQPLNGQIAGFKIWNVALTNDQMLNEAMQLKPMVTTGLYAFLPLLNGASPGVDMSGVGNDWTLSGTLSANRAAPPVPWTGRIGRAG